MSFDDAAHGGPLKPLLVDNERAVALKREAVDLPSWFLTANQVCDLELLLNGSFSPLSGYLDSKDLESIYENVRLADGTVWPIPITLGVNPEFVKEQGLREGARVALRHPEGMVLAVLTISEVYEPDRIREAEAVFGTADDGHPGVFDLLHYGHAMRLAGPVEGVELPPHHHFLHLRQTPTRLRELFRNTGSEKVLAFQTRNPMHRAHVAMVTRAAEQVGADILVHPVVGATTVGDVDAVTRIRCYQSVLKYLPERTRVSLLPLAMRMAGPREAVWHAIIRRNHGCTHFVIGRDHAGPKHRKTGEPLYGMYDAQELVARFADELGIQPVPMEEVVYSKSAKAYRAASEVTDASDILRLSGTELRRRLRQGADIPDWFSFPEVLATLRKRYPARNKQGFTVFFTGLPSSGKSTLAAILEARLMEVQDRPITLLDGDIVRKNLSSELNFSKEHRDLNILRIGFVAKQITKNGGVALCAPIAPYAVVRRKVRDAVAEDGGFLLVHVSTPLDVCEARDRKGLYAKARKGILKGFTGVDDPYEAPDDADLVIDTSQHTAQEAVEIILKELDRERYIELKATDEEFPRGLEAEAHI